MTKVLLTESSLNDIAEAIRGKNGSANTYKPGQMAAAITALPTGITPTGTIPISANGSVDVTQYAYADVNVPNSYAAGDEGKVVSNGALVAQSSGSVTQNGIVDTTLINRLTVNVSGGGGGGYPKVMTQGQVSTTTDYATATFDSGVDITQYYGIMVVMYENGIPVAAGGLLYTSLTSKTFYLTGDREYTMSLTPTTIRCTRYTGAYRNLYVDVYGINL